MDKEHKAFVEMVGFLQPTQQQLDHFQEDSVLCAAGLLDDHEVYCAFSNRRDTTIMTVSRAAAQRVNRIKAEKLFASKEPFSTVHCAGVAGQDQSLPYRGMDIAIKENWDKAAHIMNGQQAKVVNSHGKSIILAFPDGQKAFAHPVSHHVDGEGDVTLCPFTPAYARTIWKSQGQNLKHLLVWLDCQGSFISH